MTFQANIRNKILHRLPTTICHFDELKDQFCIFDTGQHVAFFPMTQQDPSAADTIHTDKFSIMKQYSIRCQVLKNWQLKYSKRCLLIHSAKQQEKKLKAAQPYKSTTHTDWTDFQYSINTTKYGAISILQYIQTIKLLTTETVRK